MKTSGSLFPGLCRTLALAVLTVLPGGVRAEAMSDAAFVELCREGTTEQVRKALKDGANVNAGPESGWTALMIAARDRISTRGDDGVFGLLVSAGANLSAKTTDGYTMLMAAAAGGNSGIIRKVLEAGADVNARDDEGKTALMYAMQYGSDSPEAEAEQAKAAAEAVRMLLEAGADAKARDNEGHDALWHARQSGNNEIIRLLESGADKTAAKEER